MGMFNLEFNPLTGLADGMAPPQEYAQAAPPPAAPAGGLVGVTAPSVPGPAEGSPRAAIDEAIRLASTDPARLTPAQVTIIDKLGLRHLLRAGVGVLTQVKMGEQRSGTSATQQVIETPEARAARERAAAMGGQVGDVTRQGAEVEAANAQRVVEQTDKQVAALEQRNAADETRLLAHQDEVAKLVGQAEKSRNEYRAAAAGVDPNRVMRGGRGVLASISMALGAMGASLSRGPNFAQQIIEGAIARDWQDQKDKVAAKRDDMTVAQQSLQNSRLLFADETSARLQQRANMQSVFAAQLEGIAAKNKGTTLGQNAMQLAAMQDAAAADSAAQLAARLNQTKSSSSTTSSTYATTTPAGVTDDELKRMKLRAETESAIQKAERDRQGISEQDESAQKDVAKRMEGMLTALTNMPKLVEANKATAGFAGGVPIDALSGNDAIARSTLEANVAQNMATAKSGLSYTEGQEERMSKLITGGSWRAAGRNTALETTMGTIATELKSALGNLHPAMREQLVARMKQAYPPAFVDAVVAGKAPQSWADLARSGGAAPRGE